jgi:hypothetical protein
MGSRGRGPAVLKWKAWRADPYKADPMSRIYLQEPVCQHKVWPPHPGSRCECDNPEKTPGTVRKDPRDGEIKKVNSLDGGYNPDDLCPEHFIARSANGLCSMCEIPSGSPARRTPALKMGVWREPRRNFSHWNRPDGLS